jgi:hypothetical protein
MAKGYEVLEMLIPQGGWIIVGNDYEDITFLNCDPITKQEFETGFDKVDTFKAQQDAEKAAAKAALLERLGITAEEATLLLS